MTALAAIPARRGDRALQLHLGVLAALLLLNFLLPEYHHGAVARIMLLALYALGYNLLFGYTGLLSLGHALYFAAGLYGAGLAMRHADAPAALALALGTAAGGALAALLGLLALRAKGVGFMIVTLMFAQAGYLTLLYFNAVTAGDEGFVIAPEARAVAGFSLYEPTARYLIAFAAFAIGLLALLAVTRSRFGRVLTAIRENEERARLLGHDVFRAKLLAMTISGLYAGAAGALYALLFGYVGASFAQIHFSIYPLLWTLLGGAGVTLGPLVGAAVMHYLVDIASGLTAAYMFVVGAALLISVLAMPRGVLGAVRERWAPWLP